MTELPLDLKLPAVPTPGQHVHLVSWGLGVESTAYLVEVLSDPDRYGIDPATMIVLHAVVGSEWRSTIADAERYLLPLLADWGVRTVQLARAGSRDADGIVVLDDTTRPQRIHRRGPWTLEDESRLSGTVPQLSHRRCSLKFKGWVLDQWIARHLRDQPFEHVIGYNAEEQPRAQRDLVYATTTRTPVHPLIEWGWTRAACSARLWAEFGVIWEKSACVFCCFSGTGKSLGSTLKRMREHPEEAATALLLEAPAIALNPRSLLYGTHSLLQRLIDDGNTAAVERFRQRLENQPWQVYEVRRIHFAARCQRQSNFHAPSTLATMPLVRARRGERWRRGSPAPPVKPDSGWTRPVRYWGLPTPRVGCGCGARTSTVTIPRLSTSSSPPWPASNRKLARRSTNTGGESAVRTPSCSPRSSSGSASSAVCEPHSTLKSAAGRPGSSPPRDVLPHCYSSDHAASPEITAARCSSNRVLSICSKPIRPWQGPRR